LLACRGKSGGENDDLTASIQTQGGPERAKVPEAEPCRVGIDPDGAVLVLVLRITARGAEA